MDLVHELGYDCDDYGCYDDASVDYPDIAMKVACAVANDKCAQGILICSTGIGMSIAANKVNGIRAALCCSVLTATRARQHNDANVLCMGEDVTSIEEAKAILEAFLDTEFEGDRHQRRIDMINDIEKGGVS